MAKAYFYLRPSADISVGHLLYPQDSTNAYSLINEEVSDSSTYISHDVVEGESTTNTSSFKMSGVKPQNAGLIIDACLRIRKRVSAHASEQITVTVNGQSFILDSKSITSDFVYGFTSQPFVDAMKSYNESTEVVFTIETTSTAESGVKIVYDYELYTAYIEVGYGNGVARKVNGDWKSSYDVYQKVNGIWELIENGYNAVGSRLSKMGHHQTYLQSVTQTCTETGLTEGYKCSICGKTLVPQTVIPANGHDYISSGGKQVCSVCQYVDGMGFTEVTYHGAATSLSQARGSLAATTVGNYALFGGGYYYPTNDTNDLYTSDIVDAYNTSLTRTIPTGLSTHRSGLAATTIGDYALFGGGRRTSNGDAYTNIGNVNTVDAYNLSLTKTVPTVLNGGNETYSATTVGDYALFCCQDDSSAYDTSLTRITAASAQYINDNSAATTVGNYALFGGGYSGMSNKYDNVYVYDTSLTQTSATSLSQARNSLAATTVGNYALFGGGELSSWNSDAVDVYDTSLTRTSATSLSVKRNSLAAATVGNYALFGGGYGGATGASATYLDAVDVYDISLTRTLATSSLSIARRDITATIVGNYALFGGGGDNNKYYSAVDAYKLQPISQ